MTGRLRVALLAAAIVCAGALPVQGQLVTGQVLDGETGAPISGAAVFLLDSVQGRVDATLVDSIGRFQLDFPEVGRYYLAAEGFGYLSATSPPIELPAGTSLTLDLELAPDPIGLDPIAVSVRNEEMEDWLTLRGHEGNPSAKFGYRSIQGQRIIEARALARDNTDFLRWLYIPISHGREVCITVAGQCADLYVDDRWIPSELIETVDLAEITAVVAVPLENGPNELHLFTRSFEFRVARRR